MPYYLGFYERHHRKGRRNGFDVIEVLELVAVFCIISLNGTSWQDHRACIIPRKVGIGFSI